MNVKEYASMHTTQTNHQIMDSGVGNQLKQKEIYHTVSAIRDSNAQ